MKLSDIFLTLFYGAASVLIIFLIVRLITRSNKPNTVVVYGDETPVYAESQWWPWAGGSYNYYPYWFPWSGWYGGQSGYYGRRWHGNRPWNTTSGRGAHSWGGGRHSGGARSGGRGGGRH